MEPEGKREQIGEGGGGEGERGEVWRERQKDRQRQKVGEVWTERERRGRQTDSERQTVRQAETDRQILREREREELGGRVWGDGGGGGGGGGKLPALVYDILLPTTATIGYVRAQIGASLYQAFLS